MKKMTEKEKQIRSNVGLLTSELEALVKFFHQGLDYDMMVYEFWNAKDILGHITFWHESFARNISDLGNGIPPNPLKGKLSEVNILSIATTKPATINELIERLRIAQKVIEEFIFLDSITAIPYKKGSRDYSREEHLEIVSKHIRKHLNDIKKAYASTKK